MPERVPLPHGVLHIFELLTHMPGGLENGDQEIEYESVQEIEYNPHKKNL